MSWRLAQVERGVNQHCILALRGGHVSDFFQRMGRSHFCFVPRGLVLMFRNIAPTGPPTQPRNPIPSSAPRGQEDFKYSCGYSHQCSKKLSQWSMALQPLVVQMIQRPCRGSFPQS